MGTWGSGRRRASRRGGSESPAAAAVAPVGLGQIPARKSRMEIGDKDGKLKWDLERGRVELNWVYLFDPLDCVFVEPFCEHFQESRVLGVF